MNNKHKRYYGEKGITLVALVVTIIVLLILAGVSLSLIMGNSGLINRAIDAKGTYANASIEEEAMMNELTKSIYEHGNIVIQGSTPGEGGGTGTEGELDGAETQIQDETPGELDGTGTEEDTYVILSIEDLVYLSNEVNSGNSFSGKYLQLGKTLDFNNDNSYVNPTSTTYGDINGNGITEALKTEMTTGKGFTPIGNYNDTALPFSGIFDGNKKSIRNLYMNVTGIVGEFDMGLFGFTNGTVKDLYMIDANITNGCYASMTGILAGNAVGTVQRCSATGSIVSNSSNAAVLCTGGLIGLTGDFTTALIDRCYTNVNITTNASSNSTATYVGGIVGQMMFANQTVSNCYSTGTINASVRKLDITLLGGICGVLGEKNMGGNSTTKIENCYSINSFSVTYNNSSSNFFSTGIGMLHAPVTVRNVYGLDESKAIRAAITSDTEAEGASITNLETVNSTEMKSATVLQNLGNAFSIKAGKNGGYPVLDWQ